MKFKKSHLFKVTEAGTATIPILVFLFTVEKPQEPWAVSAACLQYHC